MKSQIGSRIFRGVASVARHIPHFRGKYRALNALYSSMARQSSGTIVASLSNPLKYEMLLNLDCAHERLAYCVNGYEADTVQFLFRLWDRTGYFMDIGANIGLISVPFTLMAMSDPRTSPRNLPLTVALEPVASNFASLRSNADRNNLGEHIRLFNAGAGSEDKAVAIQVEGDVAAGQGTGTANILPDHSSYQCERQEIQVCRIDSLLKEEKIPKNCSLIKIDTDGYDFFAVQGAINLLRESRPIIFGEFMAHCMNWHGHTMEQVKEFADSLSYRVLVRRSGKGDWKFRLAIDFAGFLQDAMLVPSEKLEACHWCISN